MGARLNQAAHQVRVVIVVLALQQRADPLQPHAGVDALHLQGHHAAICELLVLHEDVVPDLDKPVAVLIGAARRTAPNVRPVVIENLCARTAGSGWPHAPEVVIVIDSDDLVIGKAGHLLPDCGRFVVSVIDRYAKPVGIEREISCQQLPRKGDRLFLEIVAKTEIAEHFKKCMVPRGVTHVVEIVVFSARPHAFLC